MNPPAALSLPAPSARTVTAPPAEPSEPFTLSADISTKPGELPTDLAAAQFAQLPPFENHSATSWPYLRHQYDWAVSNFCHHPIYFEDARVERYGTHFGPLVQPLASGVQFFASAPLLPLKLFVHPPRSYVCRGEYMRPPKPEHPRGYVTRVSLNFARAALYTIGFLIP